MTLLVTGVSGFLGQHTMEDLVCREQPVIAVNGPSGKPASFPSIPLYAWSQLSQMQEQPDAVISCHASVASGREMQGISELFQGNVISTDRVVNQFPAARHVYCSTVSVYEQGRGVV